MAFIRPIETHYRGHKFRSRLEARWAVFLTELGLPYDYEPEGFNLQPVLASFRCEGYPGILGWVQDAVPWMRPHDLYYLPDFWLPTVYDPYQKCHGVFLEVKRAGIRGKQAGLHNALCSLLSIATERTVYLTEGRPLLLDESPGDLDGDSMTADGIMGNLFQFNKDTLGIFLRWHICSVCHTSKIMSNLLSPKIENIRCYALQCQGMFTTKHMLLEHAARKAKQARFEYGDRDK